jgi:hypothetical protein
MPARTAVAVLLGAALATSPLAAQSSELGPFALRLPGSARTVSMANIGVTGRDDDVVFYNPAQLAIARGTSVTLTRLSPSVDGGSMSTVLRLGSGGIGIGMSFLEYATSVYPVTRSDILDVGTSAVSSILGAIGYAQTYKGFRIGATAKYASDQTAVVRYRNWYADAGVSRNFLQYYTGALSLQNIGRSLDRASGTMDPPMKATLGVTGSRPLGPLDVLASVAASAMPEGHVSPGIGAEAAWSWISGYSVAVRGGYRNPAEPGEPNYTAGLGLTADRMTFDVAAEVQKNDRVGYRAGVRIR